MKASLPDSLGNIDGALDSLLPATFIRTSSYENVLREDKFLITGRKGVGKTALARMIPIIEPSNNKWSHIHLSEGPDFFFDELSGDFHANKFLEEVSTSEFMHHMWEHFIVENCMKIAIENLSYFDSDEDFKKVNQYLEDVGQIEESRLSSLASFFRKMVELLSPEVEFSGLKISVGSGEKIRAIFDDKYNYIGAVESLFNLLKKNNFKILFLIDDIDENLDKDSSKEIFRPFVTQLIRVTQNINVGKVSSGLCFDGLLTIKAFLPTDIYSWLKLRHSDKLRSHRVELQWSDSELRQMFRKRLSELCRVGNMSLDDVVRKYFGESIYDTYANKRDVITYIIENTFGRPRDVMNLYEQLKYYLKESSDLSHDEAYAAIADYISLTVETVLNEYSFVQPNLDSILQGFEGGDSLLTYQDIYQVVAHKKAHVKSEEVNDIIYSLYEMGFFGVLDIRAINKKLPVRSNYTPIHSLSVDFFYNKKFPSSSLKRKNSHFLIHPIFRYEYVMGNNSAEYLKRIGV